jgi:hypothetical protein
MLFRTRGTSPTKTPPRESPTMAAQFALLHPALPPLRRNLSMTAQFALLKHPTIPLPSENLSMTVLSYHPMIRF